MPRKSNDEMIAELEAKLAKARETSVSRRQAEIDKLKERRVALVERGNKIATQIGDLDTEINKLTLEAEGSDAQPEQG